MTVCSPAGLPFRQALPALIFLTAIFHVNFLTRVMLGPLMVPIQQELGIRHTQSGTLFLLISVGLSLSLLASGYVVSLLEHRRVVALSAALMGVSLLFGAYSQGLAAFRLCVFGLGLGAGLYLPSGIAIITALTDRRDWGKALSVHELAPNLSFIVAPLLAEAMIRLADWRATLTVVGAAQLVIAAAFLRFRPGDFKGLPPRFHLAREIARRPGFWILTLMLGLAIASSVGPFAMLPLYLTDTHGFSRAQANELLALSRVGAVFMAFAAGYLTDRFGVRWMIGVYLLAAGACTALLGLASGGWLVAVVLVHPAVSVCFFPAGFTAISQVFETRLRNLAVSLITPMASILGLGVVPTMLGAAGDMGRFGLGFVILGGCVWLALILVPRLHSRDGAATGSDC